MEKYNWICEFVNGFAIGYLNNIMEFINKKGKIISKK